ncbi:uncharacterized protein [Dysidea avara]|uniref:uncharacterized protein n=1 Tax=Dysidea avara TaxID=196820 RepID=UPI0033223450
MRARLKRIEKKLVQRTPLSCLSDPKAAGGSNTGGLKISLPKLQLQTFDGNLLQWQEFWDTFSAAVHQQSLPPVAKFSYLKGVLKGAAAATISGISVSNENYDMALLLLRERCRRPEKIIESLYSQLQLLPRSSNKLVDLKRTSDSVEKILRQSEALSEPIVQQILSKFPLEFLIKLEESKDPKIPCKMKEDFESDFVLTPTHFLTGNRDVIPSCLDYSDGVDYFPRWIW